MPATEPHYLLYSEVSPTSCGAPRWKFVLQSVADEERFSATDTEWDARNGRLELLAVVRGLEAIDQPARVTLLTSSRYVCRGIRRDLSHWRERHWRWERFGQLVPIRDHDLWQRVDRALQFHKVECCVWNAEDTSATDDMPVAGRAAVLRPRPFQTPVEGRWSVAAAIGRLRRGVLSPIFAIWRPTFTQAA